MRLALLGITLLAFALRLYKLADQNVWWDEGWTVWLSRRDWAWIALRTAADPHPPLHYWLVRGWDMLVGESAFAVRFSSVLLGTLAVPLVYRLGRLVANKQVGILAVVFLAVARFDVWWSQEIRMYALAVALAVASLYLALRILRGGNRWLWLAYVAVTAAAIYTHYLSLLIVLSENLLVLIMLVWPSPLTPFPERARGERRRLLVGWVAAQLALVAIVLPWAYIFSQHHVITWIGEPPMDFSLFLRLYATVLSMGLTTNVERYTLPVLGFVLVAAAGLVPLWRGRREQREGSLLLWLCLVVTPLLIYLFSLPKTTSFYIPKVDPRYLIILLPAFLLVLAWGLDVLRRRSLFLATAALVFVLGGLVAPLPDYFAERHLSDDYQSLVDVIQAYAQPGDAVLLHTDADWPVFAYHEQRELPWYGVPYRANLDAGSVEALLSPIVAQHPAVWLVVIPEALARDPQGLVEKWLAAHYQREANITFGDKRLALYSQVPRSLQTVPLQNLAIEYPMTTTMPGGLTLLGFDLPVRGFWTGETARLALYWRGPAAAEEPRLAIALLDARGQPVHQVTSPLKPGYPRSEWQSNEVVRGEYAISILSTVPSGNYSLALRLGEGDPWLRLASVRVVRRAGEPLPANITHPRRDNLANRVLFLGYDLQEVPAAGEQPAGTPLTMRPGEALDVTLYWQAQEQMEQSYKVFVHLLGEAYNPATGNRLWGQQDSIPGQGTYPTTGWAVGEVVADRYTVTLQADAPPGDYVIEIGLYDGTTGERLSLLGAAGNVKDDRIILETVHVITK
jgi:4-amino-4-deoxy-L-arabinose transferase-like glycosyltransferase